MENVKAALIEACMAHAGFTNTGDHKRSNKAHDRIIALLGDLKKLPDHGLELLLSLLENENKCVQAWAATYLLPIEEGAAINTLEGVAAGSGLDAFSARMVLKLWSEGTLQLVDWP